VSEGGREREEREEVSSERVSGEGGGKRLARASRE
jgi:hypothetical protein